MIAEFNLPKIFARIAVIAIVAIGASACSSVPNWVDPTNWMGGSDDQAANSAGSDQTPDLASIPDKPKPPSTPDEREKVTNSLAADRADAQYSADALRGGTEPPAAPPPDASASSVEVATASASASSSAAPAANNAPAASADTSAAAAAPAVAPATDTASAAPASDQSTAQTASAAPATQVASAEQPAAETNAAPAAAPAVSNDQLGFQSSKAPPLDPAVARFVPRTVLQRYDQTSASGGQQSAAPALTPPADPPQAAAPQKSSAIDPPADGHGRRRVASTTEPSDAPGAHMLTPAAYVPAQQSRPVSVVFFPETAATLDAKSRAQILTAAQSFQTRGNGGFVRVVGHSSSRTGDMPMARHLELVFERSQEYAAAVANELVRDGVPADKVLIEAVGDSQPVYYESMPQGEEGNRRTEIFM